MRPNRMWSGGSGKSGTAGRLKWMQWLAVVLVLLALNGAAGLWNRARLPEEFRDPVVQMAGAYGLDPLLVAAIAKAESNYQTDAISRAGAVGLMQLMPETADWTAGLYGDVFCPDALFDPLVNLQLGCRYFSLLSKRYEGNLTLALAAYNAGLGNVDRWLAQGRWDGQLRNARDIPFQETRDYVIKVHLLHRVYQVVYRDWTNPPGVGDAQGDKGS